MTTATKQLAVRLPLVFITYVSSLHALYALTLYASATAAQATATANIVEHIPADRFTIATLLLLSAVIAAWAVYFEWPPSRRSVVFMGLQTVFVSLAGVGAIDAVLDGHFADGVERSAYFILADQGPSIVAMVVHNYAVVAFHSKDARTLWRA